MTAATLQDRQLVAFHIHLDEAGRAKRETVQGAQTDFLPPHCLASKHAVGADACKPRHLAPIFQRDHQFGFTGMIRKRDVLHPHRPAKGAAQITRLRRIGLECDAASAQP